MTLIVAMRWCTAARRRSWLKSCQSRSRWARSRHSAEQVARESMAADRLLAEGKNTSALTDSIPVSRTRSTCGDAISGGRRGRYVANTPALQPQPVSPRCTHVVRCDIYRGFVVIGQDFHV